MASTAVARPRKESITLEQFLAADAPITVRAPLAPGQTRPDFTEAEIAEMMAELEKPAEPPRHVPISPLAKEFDAAGMNHRARRIDYCQHYRVFHCPTDPSHTERQTMSCMQEACPTCRRRLFEDRQERFHKTTRYMRRRKHYTLVELSGIELHDFPTNLQLSEFADQVAAFIDQSVPTDTGTGVRYRVDIDYRPSGFRLMAYVLWWGEAPEEGFMAPEGCLIKIMSRSASHLAEDLKFIHTYNVPPSHQLSAQLEISDEGIRRIRSAGQISRHDPEAIPESECVQSEGNLFAMPPEVANNSPETAPGCCKKCGSRFTEVTEWMPPGLTPEEIGKIRRYTIPEPAPPPPE